MSTSALNPSTSASPRQVAENAFSRCGAHLGDRPRVGGQLQAEVVEVDGAVGAAHLVRPLVGDPHAERVQHRQDGGEHHRLAVAEHLEPDVRRRPGGAGRRACTSWPGSSSSSSLATSLHRLVRRVLVLVGVRERAAVALVEHLGLALVVELALQHQPEVVVPEPGGLGEPLGQVVDVDVAGRVAGSVRTMKWTRASFDSLTRVV